MWTRVVDGIEYDALGVEGEIITEAEALRRVGLGDLAPDETHHARYVEWKGYPQPFHCGHTAVYGFGPLDDPEKNDRRGSGRRYQENVRVSQHHCSGNVLFSWGGVGLSTRYDGRKYAYRLNSGMAVSVDTIPDTNSTCLKVVHPC
jgi:hypothetical protein